MTTPDPRPVALITGGTSGIGRATAEVLRERGYAVVVTGRNPATLAAAEATLPDDVTVLSADAGSLADADRLVDELRHRFGRVDLAVLNAAVARMTPFETMAENAFDEHFAVNVKGPLFLVQKLLPLLRAGSSVVVTSSVVADKAMPSFSAYSATKGAQLALVRALAAELAPRGIRVNAVSPGVIDTPAHEKLGLPVEVLAGMQQMLSAQIPLDRMGSAGEVASAVAFLASPEAAYITAANTVVAGGFGAVAA